MEDAQKHNRPRQHLGYQPRDVGASTSSTTIAWGPEIGNAIEEMQEEFPVTKNKEAEIHHQSLIAELY